MEREREKKKSLCLIQTKYLLLHYVLARPDLPFATLPRGTCCPDRTRAPINVSQKKNQCLFKDVWNTYVQYVYTGRWFVLSEASGRRSECLVGSASPSTYCTAYPLPPPMRIRCSSKLIALSIPPSFLFFSFFFFLPQTIPANANSSF